MLRICAAVPQRVQGPLYPEGISRAGRVGLSCLLCAWLLSFRAAGWEPSARAQNRGIFMPPLPRVASGSVFFSSRAAGIQWAETLPPALLW